jgi:phosphopantothenoylcysteine decarboxylase/phosphopantothenate--cysteine ligase
MTEGAERFIGALTFAALTHRPVLTSLWDAPESIPHIALARRADAIAIVPATANVIAKVALGIADDLLSNVALAARVPLVVAPAMNSAMYEHPATQGHLATLRARGVFVVEPEAGFLAERESGIGRLAEQATILAALDACVRRSRELAGQRVLVTAGPTREAIDPVRFLSNPSTGTMGIALAREALERGAEVDLVLGPTTAIPPAGARVVRVVSAQEMYEATLARATGANVAIASAAVSDWRPVERFAHKQKKSEGGGSLSLERTPDILATLGARKNGTFLVGFAAETRDAEALALEKLAAKGLDAIAVNEVGREDAGFGPGPSELVLLWPEGGREDLGRGGKNELARRMWDVLQRVRAERHLGR